MATRTKPARPAKSGAKSSPKRPRATAGTSSVAKGTVAKGSVAKGSLAKGTAAKGTAAKGSGAKAGRGKVSASKKGATTRGTATRGEGRRADADAALGVPHPEDRAAQIRHAAFVCFSERGYHETSVDMMCREAGISKGAFYWYFESKEAVFLQILEVWADEVEREVLAQFRQAFTSKEPVGQLLAALGREGRRGRRVLPVWLDGFVQSQRNPALREALARFMARVRAALTDVIRPAFAPYHSEEEIRLIAGLLFSCFIGAISQHIVDPDAGHYDEQSRQLLVTTERFATLLAKNL